MKNRKLLLAFVIAFGTVGVVLTLAVLTGSFKVFSIPTNGMAPTIRSGDRITATRILSPAKSVRRNDVVVFDAHQAYRRARSKFVQRAVALPGDRIEVIDGRFHVNGNPLPDRDGEVPRPASHADPRFAMPSYPLVIPPGKVFTLGDNHGNSLDSRYFGPFPIEAITHSADRVIFPFSRAGRIE